MLAISGVQQSDRVATRSWNQRQHVLHQIAVRIQQHHTHAGRQVLGEYTRKEVGLARTGLAEDDDVAQPVLRKEAKALMLVAIRCLPELRDGRLGWVIHGVGVKETAALR